MNFNIEWEKSKWLLKFLPFLNIWWWLYVFLDEFISMKSVSKSFNILHAIYERQFLAVSSKTSSLHFETQQKWLFHRGGSKKGASASWSSKKPREDFVPKTWIQNSLEAVDLLYPSIDLLTSHRLNFSGKRWD